MRFWGATRALATEWRAFCCRDLPKVLRTWQFLLSESELSPQSDARFSDRIFQKCHVFAAKNNYLAKIAFWLRSCAFFVDTETRQQRLHFGDSRAALPEKCRVLCPAVFHPWIHIIPICYMCQLLDDEWLTCGWHRGVNANQDHHLNERPLVFQQCFNPCVLGGSFTSPAPQHRRSPLCPPRCWNLYAQKKWTKHVIRQGRSLNDVTVERLLILYTIFFSAPVSFKILWACYSNCFGFWLWLLGTGAILLGKVPLLMCLILW